jgi:proteasome assembly chaperone (PAC2) family protein
VIYIPGVLLIGVTLGYLFGARAARAEMTRAKKRLRE